MRQVLIVDDEAPLRELLRKGLEGPDISVCQTGSGIDALTILREKTIDVAILDVRMPEMNGLELLRNLKEISPSTEVIMLTADATLDTAVEAMRLGACDFVTKPFFLRGLKERLNKAIEKADLKRDNVRLQRALSYKETAAEIVGASPAMKHVMDLVRQVAPTQSPVLVTGESGTGKELVSRAIHDLSSRSGGTFIAVNCGAFQETLLESELFGHKKGSFTGAVMDKPGLFDVASGGTLFLDEVGETTLSMQVKLLRVLDTKTFRPIGDTRERTADFRLVAATNRDLRQMIAEKTFREDLFYRLNVVSIELPPLRERLDDIPELVSHIVRTRAGAREQRPPSRALLEAFKAYHWPGNIRELVNQIERSVILSRGPELEPVGFPPAGAPPAPAVAAPAAVTAPAVTLEEQEKSAILQALEKYHGNVSRAAAALGINRRTLHRKLKTYGLVSYGRSD